MDHELAGSVIDGCPEDLGASPPSCGIICSAPDPVHCGPMTATPLALAGSESRSASPGRVRSVPEMIVAVVMSGTLPNCGRSRRKARSRRAGPGSGPALTAFDDHRSRLTGHGRLDVNGRQRPPDDRFDGRPFQARAGSFETHRVAADLPPCTDASIS